MYINAVARLPFLLLAATLANSETPSSVNVTATVAPFVTAKPIEPSVMHRITKPITIGNYSSSADAAPKRPPTTAFYKAALPPVAPTTATVAAAVVSHKDNVFRMSANPPEKFVPSPQLSGANSKGFVYERNAVPVVPARGEAKTKGSPPPPFLLRNEQMSSKPVKGDLTSEDATMLYNQKRSPQTEPPQDWYNKVKFPSAPSTYETPSTKPQGFNFGEPHSTVEASLSVSPCDNAPQVSLNSPCVVNANDELPRHEPSDYPMHPPPPPTGLDGKLENIDGKFANNDPLGYKGPSGIASVVPVPYNGISGPGSAGKYLPPSGPGYHGHGLAHGKGPSPLDHLHNYGIGVKPKEPPPPFSYDAPVSHSPGNHHALPWKKIFKFLTTFLPIGLLLSALTPSIITIGPMPNMTYGPQPTYVRGRSADDESSSLTPSLGTFLSGCEEKIVCQLVLDNVNSKLDVEALLQSFSKYERTAIEDNEDLKKLFEAVKQKNCSLLECGSANKRLVKDINLQKLAKT